VERGERGWNCNTCRNENTWEIILQWILKIARSSSRIIIIIITPENSHIGHCTHTSENANAKEQ